MQQREEILPRRHDGFDAAASATGLEREGERLPRTHGEEGVAPRAEYRIGGCVRSTSVVARSSAKRPASDPPTVPRPENPVPDSARRARPENSVTTAEIDFKRRGSVRIFRADPAEQGCLRHYHGGGKISCGWFAWKRKGNRFDARCRISSRTGISQPCVRSHSICPRLYCSR